ncbi:Dynamin family protein [Haloechinothrix alba]|uniref:Dynamin family protein n=1 Tax=Haloechinothrix alba TaxID=664784 RepID=A0A238VM71_9PSEU|nr:Dynamin family protein [Haloechinothrix alba]
MTVASGTAGNDAVARAAALVDLGLRACEAFERPDLAARLERVQSGLADPAVHVVVVGEFKQGKSSLVNALVGANACPVDDDVATAVPTYVRHGEQPSAELIVEGSPPLRQPVALQELRRRVIERDPAGAASGADEELALAGAEVRLPRTLLSSGLVLVDTPGVGGLGSAHAAASLAAASMASALIFVTDASQELTRSELDFLHKARDMCGTVACALTKIDFYPHWRRIRDLDVEHLREHGDVPCFPVSSRLRSAAAEAGDTELNTESGYPALVSFLTEHVGASAAHRVAADAAADVAAVCTQLEARFEAERAALADPAEAQRVVSELTAVKERIATLKSTAAKWNQTLSDGVTDLNSDVEHDLRRRIRTVIAEADDVIEESDPADTWTEMEAWLRCRVSHELLANYALLRDRSTALGEEVGEHFREASGDVLDRIAVPDPELQLAGARVEHKIELAKMKVGKQAMVALKSAYSGAIMFVMLGTLTGVTLGPIALGIGLVMGGKGLREEKKRQRANRQKQAQNAVRRYCDEVSFVMGKDSKDTLRTIQRQLRDHYTGLAEELDRSNAQALQRASDAASHTRDERDRRLADIDAELGRLRQLRERAMEVVG